MQRGEDQVTCQRGLDRDLCGFQITGLADHDAVRILSQECPQDIGESQARGLVDRNLENALDLILDRILRREELGVDGVDLVEAGVEGCCFARTGRTADNEDAVWFFDDLDDEIVDLRWHLEGFQFELDGASVKHAEHDALPELGGQAGDTQVDDLVSDLPLDSPVLRNPPLGDVEIRHHLDAGGDGKRKVARRRLHLVEGAIDAVADLEFLLEGLEVNVARLRLDGAVEDEVDVADDGGGIRLSRDRGGVEILLSRVDFRDFRLVELPEHILHGGLLRAIVRRNQAQHRMTRSDHLRDLPVQGEAEILEGLRVEGVAKRHGEHVARCVNR